jgi:hypothetical protein
MATAKRKCCGCKDRFKPETMIKLPVGYFCLLQCSIDYVTRSQKRARDRQAAKARQCVAKVAKEARTKLRADKERIKTRPQYIKDAQTWFNKFIRLRDKEKPCICCDRPNTNDIQWHAGHFLTTGARPEHRFNENNCHKQTSYCNNHLSGNVAEYRKRLIIKIGLQAVEEMERDHEPKKYTIDELKVIIQDYKDRCKLIK